MAQKEEKLVIVNNFINNEFVEPSGGKNSYMNVISPNNGKIIGKVALSNMEDVKKAVIYGDKAFEKWSLYTVKERMRCLLKLRSIIEERELELAQIIMLEHGKNKTEALGDIRKGNETIEYACGMPSLIGGKVLEVSHGVECKEYRLPHGIVASIVPFNFPLMVPLWTIPIAIAVGNVIIVKPSEKVPLTLNKFASYIIEAGFPSGVFQIINGQADAVNALIEHNSIKAISFVGSSKIAEYVYKKCKNLPIPKRCLALGGAKNHLISLNDCNIDMTSSDIVNSFCGCTGQRCMAASVLLLIKSQKELLLQIIEKTKQLLPLIHQDEDNEIDNNNNNIDNNDNNNNNNEEKKQEKDKDNKDNQKYRCLGPVIDELSINKIVKYIDMAEKDGNEILVDGRKWINKYSKKSGGYWIGPTIILLKKEQKNHPCIKEEIFGPLLTIYECESNEEAIEIENNNPYGNAACIYTSTGAYADWFMKRFSAGMIGVNIGVPVPREPFAFGGINLSKFGDHDITDDGGIEFWTWRKKVTTKWTIPQIKTWMD